MSVKIRPFTKSGREDGWEVDIRIRYPDGTRFRERVKAPVSGKNAALRWAQEREAHLLRDGRPQRKEVATKTQVPTLEAFAERYIEEYARANRQKPSTIIQKERIIKHDLKPRFGTKPLDEISDTDVQRLKSDLAERSEKTVNNILVVLSTMLRCAVKWGVVERLPAKIELLKVRRSADPQFYEPHEYERLVAAAAKVDPRIHLLVLLGGDAGLRCGEIIALEQSDVDLKRGVLTVRRSEWEGHVTVPKGGRARKIVLTERLKAALAKNHHLRGDRVLWRDDGFPKVTQVLLGHWMKRAQRQAGLKVTGGLHILRHTFCSRLAMAGASTKAIQELAGHQQIGTTQRYMHLSPAAKSAAIALLDRKADIAACDALEAVEKPLLEAVDRAQPEKEDGRRLET